MGDKTRSTRNTPKEIDIRPQNVSTSSQIYQGIKSYSPVTDLAMNLGELSTKYNENTPRRKLSLCSSGTPTPVAALKSRFFDTQLSFDDGCCVDSPSPVDTESSFSLDRFGQPDNDKSNEKYDIPSKAFRRFQSMPVPFCGFDPSPPSTQVESRLGDRLDKFSPPCSDASPALSSAPARRRSPLKPVFSNNIDNFTLVTSPCRSSDDENSQDSGVCLDSKDSAFKFPLAPAPRSIRFMSDESRSPLRYSPVAKNAPKNFKDISQHLTGGVFKESPFRLKRSTSETDDGIDIALDIFDNDQEGVPNTEHGPSIKSLDSLFNTRVLSASPSLASGNTPKLGSRLSAQGDQQNQENIKPARIRRGLFRSPSAPRLFQSKSHPLHTPLCSSPILQHQPVQQKRAQPGSDDTPRVSKRRKSITDRDCHSWDAAQAPRVPPPELHRCHSSEAIIKSALNRQASCPDLVGDMSRPYTLPLCKSKHNDLKAIDPATLSAVLNGEYDDVIEKCVIIDSRYPYEYEGGHIKGAKNLYTKDQILEEFFKKEEHKLTKDSNKRTVLVFHCEFSSERGPKMSRFLRSQDRQMNKELYPFLNYPEIYLLEGGYKRFFEEQKSQCVPETYKPMLHEAHGDDLKYFRLKSKSWAGEREGRGPRSSFRGLKF